MNDFSLRFFKRAQRFIFGSPSPSEVNAHDMNTKIISKPLLRIP